MVEAQHVAATMKLVDTPAEQNLLEALLDDSKPPPPANAAGLHYLVATPFRYDPLRSGSRFRGVTDPGVFYGAQSVRTAAAELGYWRWKFLCDAVGLTTLEPVAHSAFAVEISGATIDLRAAPFDRDHAVWSDRVNFAPTQAFGRVARTAAIAALLYQSVRDPRPAWCLALLTPTGFARPRPRPRQETWFLAVTRHEALWRRDGAALRFAAAEW